MYASTRRLKLALVNTEVRRLLTTSSILTFTTAAQGALVQPVVHYHNKKFSIYLHITEYMLASLSFVLEPTSPGPPQTSATWS
ncbi:hypothetical protein RRG08_003424 [Elysia crispata]|uniref:Uncharacterized protein n=1 Tax=Elysia crispata TaxID=231223 RepID=A0AAE1ACP1_9GAST|nr:hypothetical protein RRG08_003424 [Elysia crispata]